MKGSIPYSQALRIRETCSETPEVIKHIKDLKELLSSKEVTNLKFWTITFSVDRGGLRTNNKQPKEIYHQYLLSTKHNLTLKTLLINIGIFCLSTKIYEKFLIKDHSFPIEDICTN